MNAVVIDTNVLRIADQQHTDVSEACIYACVERLLRAKTEGVVVIDDAFRIIVEYSRNPKLKDSQACGAFLKWLLQNRSNTNRVHQVSITETVSEHFAEFPDQVLQPTFDAPDRKFPAVANAHPNKPPVLQAADCKWLKWWQALHATGITVDFVCPDDLCRFYQHKFPGQTIPVLP